MARNLDRFYSQESIELWQSVLGAEMHYHFGFFSDNETLDEGQRRTVRNFFAHVPRQSSVLDVGCGWGGPATLLRDERGCRVHGVTISSAQAAYCRKNGLDISECDVERHLPDGRYDVVFMLESLSHIVDIEGLLKRVRSRAQRLLLSVNCIRDGSSLPRQTFGGSMTLRSESELQRTLEQAGWTIRFACNRRVQSLRTNLLWKRNLDHAFGDQPAPGQLGVLRGLVETALANPAAWCHNYPLIDIVAD